MPAPAAGFHSSDAVLLNLGSEERTEPVPPVPYRLVADVDTALVQQVFDIAKRQREPDVEHDRPADDLLAGF
jgi:hypothetical protein